MFLGVNEAIELIQEVTKQKCNEITLLHYVWNGYLDLYIVLREEQKIDIVSVGCRGLICDDDWFVFNLKKNYEGLLKVQLSELQATELLNVFQKEDYKIKIDLVTTEKYPNIQYCFLTQKPTNSMPFNIKHFYEDETDELIDVCELNDSLGLGYFFNKFHFSIDENQINNLISDEPLTATHSGIDISNQRQNIVKDEIILIAKGIYIKDKTLTKQRLAMDTIEYFKKNIDKLNARKEELNIQGEIVLPCWDTVRRWKKLSVLMDEINPDRNK